jgi:hypothetical protein
VKGSIVGPHGTTSNGPWAGTIGVPEGKQERSGTATKGAEADVRLAPSGTSRNSNNGHQRH